MKTFYQKYKPYYADSLKLAIPVVISQAGHMVVQMSDGVVVGHFAGTISLAAVSLANSVFYIPMMIGVGISYGITPLIAQSNGRNDKEECGRLLANGLFINIITSVILGCAIYFGATVLLAHLDQSPAVVSQAQPFLRFLALSVVPMLVFTTFKQFAEGLGFTKQAMLISIWGNVINICLGIVFVKGLFGIHPMGVRGVGLSTLIDRTVMAVVMAAYVFRSKNFRGYIKTFAASVVNKARGLEIFKIGAPVALQYTFELGAFSSAAILIGTMGPIPQASHLVAMTMAALTYMMASGISSAAAIRSGNYFGSNDHDKLKLSAMSNYHIVIAFMTFSALVFTFGSHLLPWIFTSDDRVITIASQLLIIAAAFQLFDGTQVVGLGVLRGMGDVNIPTIITLIAYWVIGLPSAWLLGIHYNLGVKGIWYGLVLGLLTASGLLYIRFTVISRRYRLKVPAIVAAD